MINIYYGPQITHPLRPIWEPLEPLSKSIKSFHKDIDQETLGKCPSFAEHVKKTYVIKCPCDGAMYRNQEPNKSPKWIAKFSTPMDIGMGNRKLSSTPEDERFDESMSQILNDNFYLFFADKSVKIRMTPPYLHHGKVFGVAGDYDIGKWFRPLSIATFCDATVDNPIFFKKGDPLAYVSFDTQEKYKLIEVDWPEKVFSFVKICTDYKQMVQFQPLRNVYDFFVRNGWRRHILAMAKEAVIK